MQNQPTFLFLFSLILLSVSACQSFSPEDEKEVIARLEHAEKIKPFYDDWINQLRVIRSTFDTTIMNEHRADIALLRNHIEEKLNQSERIVLSHIKKKGIAHGFKLKDKELALKYHNHLKQEDLDGIGAGFKMNVMFLSEKKELWEVVKRLDEEYRRDVQKLMVGTMETKEKYETENRKFWDKKKDPNKPKYVNISKPKYDPRKTVNFLMMKTYDELAEVNGIGSSDRK